jgi:hypothetical protein
MARAHPEALLEAVYEQLGFGEAEGALLPASDRPEGGAARDWIERGDWLSLAKEVGVEKIFFVGQDPVVVFARVGDSDAEKLRRLYNRIWCMARPQLLFLARPGELGVYDLARPPVKPDEKLTGCARLLDIVETATEVQAKLASYHREKIETGLLFAEKRFGDGLGRADRALIRDLKTVRRSLMEIEPVAGREQPSLHHLHSLIGRAIFIRYLEDRKVLTRDYFEGVASRRRSWANLLDEALPRPCVEPEMEKLCFLRILRDKDFTYALFDKLAEDFNGDTFPVDKDERLRIHAAHLRRLLGFLVGEPSGQESLFFFAYQFDVIPIELISSIYEEFYGERKGKEQSQASHYTPAPLVEFVISQTLTPDVLAEGPRVMDPSCGSGIFLVESFRRMVRHKVAEQGGKRLSRTQLGKILRKQIAGMDINEEAVHVAAFSLYLAFLHYQEPREINEERRLPYLKWVPPETREEYLKKRPDAQFYDVLLHGNAFAPISGLCPPEVAQRFGAACAHVVVGNPPWGYPKKDDKEGRKALKVTLDWCDPEQGRPIGDKELSQAFIHLSLALLVDGGKAGLLVSSGVLFKHQENSRAFRRIWLGASHLGQVVNFAHVRRVYFTGPTREVKAIAPFLCVVFEKVPLDSDVDRRFEYWSAKRTAMVENTQAVVLSKSDMHWLVQRDCRTCDKLWKIYWWGGHRDEALIRLLDSHLPLLRLPEELPGVRVIPGRGFLEGSKAFPCGWLAAFKELPVESLQTYGPQSLETLVDVPTHVERTGQREVFEGSRLLLRRGVPVGGKLTIRHETRPYCFRHSILGFRLEGFQEWQEKVILGIYWSSLARYYFFMTLGSWGMWHDELQLEAAGGLPIVLPVTRGSRREIVDVVEELQHLATRPGTGELFGKATDARLHELECQLDERIFDLYALNEAERDLIREMCTLGLEFFYRDQESVAAKPLRSLPRSWGTYTDVAYANEGLGAYLRVFLQAWNSELEPDGELAWRVLSPPSGAPLLAVNFTTRFKREKVTPPSDTDTEAWKRLLEELEKDTRTPAGSSAIFIDSFFHVIGEREMLFIKRNETRFWTRTAAREDAEAALVALMWKEQAQVVESK